MKSFFKYVLATVTGIIISCVLLFLLIIAIAGVMLSSMGDKETVVPNNAVLMLDLNHEITEKTEPNPFENLELPGIGSAASIGLNDIESRIAAAKQDDRIKGIYLNVSSGDVGFATARAIREAIQDFKTSGKFVVAYSDMMSSKGYYINSVADEVYLHPEGGLDFRGLAASVVFFKEAMEKLGVEMQVLKVGTYKSAVEPFLLNSMSDANREQMNSYLNSIYDQYIGDIAQSTSISEEKLREIADNFTVQQASDAKELGLVNDLFYKDQLIDLLRDKLGLAEGKEVPVISLLKYKEQGDKGQARDGRIAVLYAYGDIVDGEGEIGQIGGDSFSRELRRLREDDKVKAVVMRVNSPGGSALASESIWREVELTKASKPIVVSMGDYAASGGYYISAAADSIFADPTTLTGSIGVFGMIPNLQGLLNNKLGIHFDAVKTAKFADMMVDLDRPLSAEERDLMQMGVNKIYQVFMQRVADGRGLEIAQVDSIGQGRVWTGAQAVDLHLVDRTASLSEAIASAAKMAGLENYRISEYPRAKDPFEDMFKVAKDEIKLQLFADEFGEYGQYFQELKRLAGQSGVQARIPYLLEVH